MDLLHSLREPFTPAGLRTLRHRIFLEDRARAAEYVGVHVATWRAWEAGRRRIPLAVFRLLSLLDHCDLGTWSDDWAGWTFYARWCPHEKRRVAYLASPAHVDFDPGYINQVPYLHGQIAALKRALGVDQWIEPEYSNVTAINAATAPAAPPGRQAR